MVAALVNLFQGLQEKIEVMFAEIREEFITICKKSDGRINLLEQENRELNRKMENSKIESMKITLMNGKIQSSSLVKQYPQLIRMNIALH